MQSGSADFHGASDHYALGIQGGELRNWPLARRDEFFPLQQRLGLRHVGTCFDLRAARRFLDRDNLLENVAVARIQFAKTGFEVGDYAIGIGGRRWGLFGNYAHAFPLRRSRRRIKLFPPLYFSHFPPAFDVVGVRWWRPSSCRRLGLPPRRARRC